MKNFKFPVLFFAFAVAIVSAFAFNTKPAKTIDVPTTYYYIGGNSITDIQDPEMWILEGEACESTGNLPCSKVFPNNVRADFDAHIAGFSTVLEAKQDANTTRN